MKKRIKGMGILVALFVLMMGTVANAATYSDVNDVGKWHYKFVMDMSERGLMQGYGDGTFGPDDSLTRAQVVEVLYKMAGKPDVAGLTENFTDVDAQWYANQVKWASANGIVTGYEEDGEYTFQGDKTITRQEFVVFVYRYEKFVAGTAPTSNGTYKSFADADEVGGWASDAMNWAVGSSLVAGYPDNTVRPNDLVTRAQCAKIISIYLCEHTEVENKLLYEGYVISVEKIKASWDELKGILEGGDQDAIKNYFDGEIPTCITCVECNEHLCTEGESVTNSLVKHMIKSIPSLLAGNGGCNRFMMYSDQCTLCGATFQWLDALPVNE